MSLITCGRIQPAREILFFMLASLVTCTPFDSRMTCSKGEMHGNTTRGEVEGA